MNRNLTVLSVCSLGVLVSVPFLAARASAAPQEPRTRGENLPPVCVIELPSSIVCQGDFTAVYLDASGSYDPEGAPLSFLWTNGCPGAGFDDLTSATPMLMIDSSASCEMGCWIRLRLSDGKRFTFCRAFVQLQSSLELALDIKPGSCPNPIQVGSHGVVPVSLLGTESFDVTTVDLTTLALVRADGTAMPVTPVAVSYEDTGTPFVGDGCDCHELTGDGYLDLSMKFDKDELVALLALDQDPDGSYVPLRLTGNLLTGEAFTAEDCVRVQGN